MTEERPKPRYGEYATPQTQAEAVADSMPPVSPLLAARTDTAATAHGTVASGAVGTESAHGSRSAPGSVPVSPHTAGAVTPNGATSTSDRATSDRATSDRATSDRATSDRALVKSSEGSWWASKDSAAAIQSRPQKRWDLVLTIALLAYGALNVASQVSQYSDITGFLNRMATLYPVFGAGTFSPTGREAAVGLGINVINITLYLGTLLLSVRRLRQRKLSFFVPLIGGAVAAMASAILLTTILANSPGFVGAVSGV
ncbi:MAG: hypothetical protein H7248_00115 [Microbacteriaceae bacterium]|nr:hypothetical protein [Microbacteriaceae bacterium]